MKPHEADLRGARLLWDYLRLDVPPAPADCLLVFGGHDLGVAGRAADLFHDGIAPLIVVSGGSRAVPDGSDFPTEADAIADVLLRRDIPKDAIALERLASNTSENFWLSAELLRDLGLDPHSFLAVTKPYAERRLMATARRRWPHKKIAVTSEKTGFEEYLTDGIPPVMVRPRQPREARSSTAHTRARLRHSSAAAVSRCSAWTGECRRRARLRRPGTYALRS